jgi:transposase
MCAYLAVRQALLVHWREMTEKNDTKLAKLAGCTRSVAKKWRKRFEQNDESLKDAPRCGRPRALDAKELQRLRNALRRGPKKTDSRATFLVNKHRSGNKQAVSVKTVNRRIADEIERGLVSPERIRRHSEARSATARSRSSTALPPAPPTSSLRIPRRRQHRAAAPAPSTTPRTRSSPRYVMTASRRPSRR